MTYDHGSMHESLKGIHFKAFPSENVGGQLSKSLRTHALDGSVIVSKHDSTISSAFDVIDGVSRESLCSLQHDQIIHR